MSLSSTILCERQLLAEKPFKGTKMEIINQNNTKDSQLTKVESPERSSYTPFEEFYSLLNQGKLEEAILLLEKETPCWEKANL